MNILLQKRFAITADSSCPNGEACVDDVDCVCEGETLSCLKVEENDQRCLASSTPELAMVETHTATGKGKSKGNKSG